jgi:hypothetical protein
LRCSEDADGAVFAEAKELTAKNYVDRDGVASNEFFAQYPISYARIAFLIIRIILANWSFSLADIHVVIRRRKLTRVYLR